MKSRKIAFNLILYIYIYILFYLSSSSSSNLVCVRWTESFCKIHKELVQTVHQYFPRCLRGINSTWALLQAIYLYL